MPCCCGQVPKLQNDFFHNCHCSLWSPTPLVLFVIWSMAQLWIGSPSKWNRTVSTFFPDSVGIGNQILSAMMFFFPLHLKVPYVHCMGSQAGFFTPYTLTCLRVCKLMRLLHVPVINLATGIWGHLRLWHFLQIPLFLFNDLEGKMGWCKKSVHEITLERMQIPCRTELEFKMVLIDWRNDLKWRWNSIQWSDRSAKTKWRITG